MAGIADLDDKVRSVLAHIADVVAEGLGDASGELRDFAVWVDPDREPADEEAAANNRFYAPEPAKPEADDKADDKAEPVKATAARKG